MANTSEGWLRSQETARLAMYEKCIFPLWILMTAIRVLQVLINNPTASEPNQLFNCAIGCIVPATYWLLHKHQRNRIKWYFVTLITEVTYTANAFSTSRLEPEQFPTLCIASTVFYLMMLQPWYTSPWMSTLMTIRHIVMWYWTYCSVFQVSNWEGLFKYPALPIAVLVSVGAWLRQKTLWDDSLDRYVSKEQADEHRRLIETMFEAVPLGVVQLDASLTPRKHNSTALSFLHCSDFSLYATLQSLRLSETGRPLLDSALSLLSREPGISLEFGQTEIGSLTLRWQGSLFTWQSQKSVLLVCSDITELVSLEHTARRESEAKTALLRSVSHELKTPLNAILSLSEDIKASEGLTCPGKEKLEVVLNSGKLLLYLINDLLDYTQALAGRLNVEKCRFDLIALIRDVAGVAELQCRSKKLRFSLCLGKLPHLAYTDPGRLGQLLMGVLNFVCK
jgi:signal transduction histidine kinase